MKRLGRAGTAAAIIAAAGGLGACSNDLLEVENPASIGTEYLEQVTSIPSLVNTAMSDFNRMYTSNAYAGAILSDEAITGHNFTQWQEFDRRIVLENNSVLPDIYVPIQVARGTAESITNRLRQLVGTPDADVRIAQMLAYQAYDYVVLAETFCQAPVTPGGPSLAPNDLFDIALAKFDSAITIAAAATKDTAGAMTRVQVRNLARVGAARAALNRGDMARAAGYAQSLVSSADSNFVWYVAHGLSASYQNNPFFGATTGANRNIGVSVHFRNINDPRVRWEASRTGHNTRTILFTPQPPPSHENHNPAVPQAATTTQEAALNPRPDFQQGGNVRFASGLEARYVLAEALGPTAYTVAFINQRRAVGGEAPLVLGVVTPADFRTAVQEQRRRDFFLDGHRLGDIRRYLALYNQDFFPTGVHEDPVYGNYETATCYVPHLNERAGSAP
ncbi:MAG TPA: hypothetical protein VFQ45_05635 [Longimicrobium sp.]|nr:hypothetical protein [Longimicrobium sp.]